MKLKKLILSLSLITFLTSCNAINDPFSKKFGYSLIMPKSIAAYPLYMEMMLEDNIKVSSVSNSIKSSFYNNKYNFIIFDSLEANTILKEQANENNKMYNFKLMLTGGNYHLLGFNKTINDSPIKDDYILGLYKNNISTKLFSYIYSDDLIDKYYSSINSLYEDLLTLDSSYKINNKNTLSWAIIDEPRLTILKQTRENNNIDLSNILDISLEEKFNEVSEEYQYDYIPQLALYVNSEFENKNSDLVNNIISRINIEINNVINYPENVTKTISSKYKSSYDQEDVFGYSNEIFLKTQDENNRLNIVPTSLNTTLDESVINQFVSLLEKE